MSQTGLTDAYTSYIKHGTYPKNLLAAKTTGLTGLELQAFWEKLERMVDTLCLPNDGKVLVPLRDFYDSSEDGIEKQNLRSSDDFDQWIGMEASEKAEEALTRSSPLSTRRPLCRFIYLYAAHSRDRLRIDQPLLTKILTYHQVMPEIVDFLGVFGWRMDSTDLHFSAFESRKEREPSSASNKDYATASFQLCYNLKGVTCKERCANAADNDWSIRQAVCHHQFDCSSGRMLWIMVKGGLDLQERFKELTGPGGLDENKPFGNVHQCFLSSLGVHLMVCRWSREGWSEYISWLEIVVELKSSIALYGTRRRGLTRRNFKPEDLQFLQMHRDKVFEVTTVLKANSEVLSSLVSFYQDLCDENESSFQEDNAAMKWFTSEIKNMVNLCSMQITRINNLKETIDGRKELVRGRLLPPLLDVYLTLEAKIMHHMQNQALDRADQLNVHLEKDAILMRIITMVTLFYLPSMFVSSFFGTDIIKFQDSNGGEPNAGKFSSVAMERWFQITLPLTAVTLALSLLAYREAGNASKRRRLALDGCEEEAPRKCDFGVGSLIQLCRRKSSSSSRDTKDDSVELC